MILTSSFLPWSYSIHIWKSDLGKSQSTHKDVPKTVAMGGLRIGIETELILQAITLEDDPNVTNLTIFAFEYAYASK